MHASALMGVEADHLLAPEGLQQGRSLRLITADLHSDTERLMVSRRSRRSVEAGTAPPGCVAIECSSWWWAVSTARSSNHSAAPDRLHGLAFVSTRGAGRNKGCPVPPQPGMFSAAKLGVSLVGPHGCLAQQPAAYKRAQHRDGQVASVPAGVLKPGTTLPCCTDSTCDACRCAVGFRSSSGRHTRSAFGFQGRAKRHLFTDRPSRADQGGCGVIASRPPR